MVSSVIDSITSSLHLYDSFDLNSWWSDNSKLSNLQRFSKFIGEVLLKLISVNIVIFVDEIDSVLSLKFKIEDFFAVIRDCYNRRADHPEYRRLNVSNICGEKARSPFFLEHQSLTAILLQSLETSFEFSNPGFRFLMSPKSSAPHWVIKSQFSSTRAQL